MKIDNKKIGFVLLGILLIALGFVFGSMRSQTNSVKPNSLIENSPVEELIYSSFFNRLKGAILNYKEGSPIALDPLSYKDNIAIIKYSDSSENLHFIAMDFANNKMYQTKFSSSIGFGFVPILIVSPNKLISFTQSENDQVELSLTDIEGNIIKKLKTYTLPNPPNTNDFYYGTENGENFISILGQRYLIDQNYNLVLTYKK